MSQTAHTPACPTQNKPPRRKGNCNCGVMRDLWLKNYADLKRAMGMTR